MNKNIAIGIVVVVLIAGGVYWFMQSPTANAPVVNPPQTPIATTSPTPSPIPAPTPTPTPSPVVTPVTHNVTIQNFSFGPASITIKKGDIVVWTNKDPMNHTVTGNNGGPSSQPVAPNGTYRYTFNTAGTFNYHCAIHPSMTGTVIVTQ